MVSDTIDPQLNIYLKTVFTLFTLYFPFFCSFITSKFAEKEVTTYSGSTMLMSIHREYFADSK